MDDEAGSIGSLDVIISQPSVILPTYTITNPPVCASGTATVEVTATGGTAPYTGTGTFTQGVGTTNYTVTDAIGCQATIPVTVNRGRRMVELVPAGCIGNR